MGNIRYNLMMLFVTVVVCVAIGFEKIPLQIKQEPLKEKTMAKRRPAASLTTTMTVPTDGVGQKLPNLQLSALNPGSYTLHFSVTRPVNPVNGQRYMPDVWAYINWKVHGQNFYRIISIGDGATISSNAEGVSVQLEDRTALLYGGGLTSTSYQVVGTLSPGIRANIQQPPILFDQKGQGLAANSANTVTLDVPEDAGVIALYPMLSSVGPKAITSAHGRFIGTASTQLGTFDALKADWIPMLPGTRQIELTNTDTGTDGVITVVWGIEG